MTDHDPRADAALEPAAEPVRDPRRDGQRVIDVSVDVPGTPEQVWAAIATGPGITSWFMPHRVDERVGGSVRMDFGAGFDEETATVTAWEPPHRVVFESGGERSLAYEWLVEARDGGSCVVRLVNSGFGAGEDWDADYDGMSAGWLIFLANLRLHLAHFAGQHARAIIPTQSMPGPKDAAFARLCEAFGVPADLQPGDRFDTSGDGVPVLGGTVVEVRRVTPVTAYFLLLDEPVPGTAFLAVEGAGDQVAASLYLYLYGPQAAALPDTWAPFLSARLGTADAAAVQT